MNKTLLNKPEIKAWALVIIYLIIGIPALHYTITCDYLLCGLKQLAIAVFPSGFFIKFIISPNTSFNAFVIVSFCINAVLLFFIPYYIFKHLRSKSYYAKH